MGSPLTFVPKYVAPAYNASVMKGVELGPPFRDYPLNKPPRGFDGRGLQEKQKPPFASNGVDRMPKTIRLVRGRPLYCDVHLSPTVALRRSRPASARVENRLGWRVGSIFQLLENVMGEMLFDLAVAGNRLTCPGPRILVPVMSAAGANEKAATLLNLPNEVSPFHAIWSSAT
jgi:hypothetical protein